MFTLFAIPVRVRRHVAARGRARRRVRRTDLRRGAAPAGVPDPRGGGAPMTPLQETRAEHCVRIVVCAYGEWANEAPRRGCSTSAPTSGSWSRTRTRRARRSGPAWPRALACSFRRSVVTPADVNTDDSVVTDRVLRPGLPVPLLPVDDEAARSGMPLVVRSAQPARSYLPHHRVAPVNPVLAERRDRDRRHAARVISFSDDGDRRAAAHRDRARRHRLELTRSSPPSRGSCCARFTRS